MWWNMDTYVLSNVQHRSGKLSSMIIYGFCRRVFFSENPTIFRLISNEDKERSFA